MAAYDLGAPVMLDIKQSIGRVEGEPPSKMRRGEGPKVELRFLISTKAAGVIIGKGGENIQKIREEMQNNRDEGVDLRLLVHQSQAGCIIGRGGYKIKELREQSGLQTLKVYQMLCPNSTDRVIQLVGDVEKVIDCLQSIAELLEGAPPKGSRQNYDARDVDESIASEYGGWGVGNQNAGLGMVQRRSNLSNATYGQGNVLAAGLFGGAGPGANVAGRSGGQAAAVTQALAGSLPHASAAAMLAATGGQTAGGPNAGPAGDAAATAAAMMAAGLMRG
ncbi:unnamed protein product [Echinostoma caproni]|uniref:KH domain-containing protein n=1 Tax=Echinostoma caproni TaxID=27848 RepID=A0A183B575_9TREM|nr:unnamed protein product [Echinostoma caproni]